MTNAISRASLLRGRFRASAPAIRPPWALPENVFNDVCTCCGDCISACAEAIVVKGSGGFPEISFTGGECTFCGDCVKACAPRALVRERDGALPWTLTVTVADTCLGDQGVVCRLCEEQCEPRAIRFPRLGGAGVPVIDRDACTGCGACIRFCPADAISAHPQQPSEAAA